MNHSFTAASSCYTPTQNCEPPSNPAGRPFNLASSLQLSSILYEVLRLPMSASAKAGRSHASTDEAALKQLAHLHELPGLVIEYR